MFHCTDWTHLQSITHTLYYTHSDPSQTAEYCLAFITVIADSYFTELGFHILVIVLPCLFSCVQILACVFGLPFRLAVRTLFTPAWTIAVYLDYLYLPCPVGYCLPETDLVRPWITLCLAYAIPVVVIDP